MTTFPGSPLLLKGAIIGFKLSNPVASVIAFKYNPDTMTRRLDARASGWNEWSDKSEPLRLTGPPRERITMNVEFDATDQVDQTGAQTYFGVYPSLSALEMLLYPKSWDVVKKRFSMEAWNSRDYLGGGSGNLPTVWGVARILPVRLTGISITEEAYDRWLNPIRARVDLDLYVLSYHDLKLLTLATISSWLIKSPKNCWLHLTYRIV